MNIQYINMPSPHKIQELTDSLAEFTHRLQKEKLAFSTLDFVETLVTDIKAKEAYFKPFSHMLLLGVGGSALGAKALQKSFAPDDRPCSHDSCQKKLLVADNMDSIFFSDCLANLIPEDTVILVISKSGSTVETITQYFICQEWLKQALPKDWQKHFFVITDEHQGFLREEVQTYGYESLPVPQSLGGRYSIFSAVGLVPCAFLGIDYEAFIQGARNARDAYFQEAVSQSSPNAIEDFPAPFRMAHFAHTALTNDLTQLIFFNYIPKWSHLGDWFRQLWAESLGKQGNGSTPIPALGATDQHSILQLFLDGPKDNACIFLMPTDFNHPKAQYNTTIPTNLPKTWEWLAGKSMDQILEAEAHATYTSMTRTKMPIMNLTFTEQNPFDMGKIMWNFGMMTILTAYFLRINPLDQPAVEDGKILAKQKLSTQK